MTIRNLLALAAVSVAFAACGGSTPPAEAPAASAAPADTAAAPAKDGAEPAAPGDEKKDEAATPAEAK